MSLSMATRGSQELGRGRSAAAEVREPDHTKGWLLTRIGFFPAGSHSREGGLNKAVTGFDICFIFTFFFWPGQTACRILVPQSWIKPWSPAVEAWSPNHWTAREIPGICFQRILLTAVLIELKEIKSRGSETRRELLQ